MGGGRGDDSRKRKRGEVRKRGPRGSKHYRTEIGSNAQFRFQASVEKRKRKSAIPIFPPCVCVCFFLFLSSLALFLSSFRAAAEPEMKKAEVSGTERMLRDSWSIGNCCYKGSSISLSFPPSPPTHSPIHPPGFLPASCLYFLPVLTLLFQSLPLRRNRFQKPLK